MAFPFPEHFTESNNNSHDHLARWHRLHVTKTELVASWRGLPESRRWDRTTNQGPPDPSGLCPLATLSHLPGRDRRRWCTITQTLWGRGMEQSQLWCADGKGRTNSLDTSEDRQPPGLCSTRPDSNARGTVNTSSQQIPTRRHSEGSGHRLWKGSPKHFL